MPEGHDDNKPDVDAARRIEEAQERARRLEAELVDAKKKLEGFDGVDVARLKAIEEDYRLMKAEKAKGDPVELDALVEAARKEAEDAYKAHLETEKSRTLKLESELRHLKVVEAGISIAAKKFNDDALDLIKLRIEKEADLVDGKVIIKDADGKPKRSKTDPSVEMTLDEFMDELAAEHPSIVRSTYTKGARPTGSNGTGAGGSSGETLTVEEYAKMTRAEQLKIDPKTRGALARAMLSRR